jgi:pyruvate kinase
MIEIRGREIRTSDIDDEHKLATGEIGVIMKAGSTVEIRTDAPTCCSSEHKLNVNYRDFPRLVKPNDLLYIDDGKIALLVVDVTMEAVICEVKQGGILGSHKSVKLPSGKHEQMPVISIQDQEELMTIVQSSELHYVAIPYAVRKRDINSVKEALGTAYGANV